MTTGIERRQAEVTQLRAAMRQLWEELERDGELPLSRALALNLIAVAPSAAEDALRDALKCLMVRHPSRVFLVLLDEAAGEIEAHVAAHIEEVGSTRQVWLQQIELRAPPARFGKVPGIVRPLIADDVPVHLYWAGDVPEELGQLTAMAQLADQTIVNSCEFHHPERDLDRLKHVADLKLVDLAYFRQRPWRRALADAFEHFEYTPDRPTRIAITHGPACAARAAVHSLAGWLRERLGAEIDIRPGEQGPASEPATLDLCWGDVHVSVRRLADQPRLRVTITLGDRCLLPHDTAASTGEVGDLLAAAVDSI